MSNVEIVIDLRMAFEQQAVFEAVPVAIVHIDTDADNEEMWFQASRAQLERLRIDIDEAIKRMEVAEAWGRREPTS